MGSKTKEEHQPEIQRAMVCPECLNNEATSAVWFRHNPGPWSHGNVQAWTACEECLEDVLALARIRSWRFRHQGAEVGSVRFGPLDD